MRRKVSTIELYKRDAANEYLVRIEHNGVSVKSGWFLDAQRAYANAESRLVIKPGYVQAIRQ